MKTLLLCATKTFSRWGFMFSFKRGNLFLIRFNILSFAVFYIFLKYKLDSI